jgi:hypothetical protein
MTLNLPRPESQGPEAQARRQESRRRFQEAQDLAEKGMVRCGACKEVHPLGPSLTVWKDGVIAFALCRPCIERGVEAVFRRSPEGYQIVFKEPRSAPLIIGSGG